jgi:copper transport protein
VLAAAPAAVTATYNEPVIAVRTALVSIDGRDTRVTAAVSPENHRRVVVPLPSRGPGAYRVSWVAVSADGHPVAGETAFRVRRAPVTVTLLRTAARVRAVARSVEAAIPA